MMGGLKSTMGGIGALDAPQNDGGLKSTMGGIGALNAPQNDVLTYQSSPTGACPLTPDRFQV